MKLIKKIRDRVSGAADSISDVANSSFAGASKVKQMAEELADDLSKHAPDISAVRKILLILDYIPFIKTEELNKETLDKSLCIIQMGKLCVMASYDGKEPDVHVLRMENLSLEKTNTKTGGENFYAMSIGESEDPDEPNINLIINKQNFSDNHRHLTADIIVEGFMLPVRRIPVAGDVIAAILAMPMRPIARFLINTIYTQADNIADLIVRDKPEAVDKVPEQDNLPPPTPAKINLG